MRASRKENRADVHLSGCERIIDRSDLTRQTESMIERAMSHSRGEPDFINIKIETVNSTEIVRYPALPVRTIETESKEAGYKILLDLLRSQGIRRAEEILDLFRQVKNKRGAVLLNADTLEALEPDHERGVRVTRMDADDSGQKTEPVKNHYREAIVLATKTANAPHMIGEICVSDDPDYVTGYFASLKTGYIRLTRLKDAGSSDGGRIFLFRGNNGEANETIRFLENQYVLVTGIPDKTGSSDAGAVEIENNKSILERGEPETRSQKKSEKTADIVSAGSDLEIAGATDGSASSLRKFGKREHFRRELQRLKDNNLYRTVLTAESAQRSHVYFDGQEKLMLASNGYLDLSADPRVIQAASEAESKYGIGSGGSRLTTGTTLLHNKLETALAEFERMESAIIFNTGYVANLSTIAAFCGKEDVIFSDELNHASIIDGCRLSGAKIVVYRHNDMADLERKMAQYRSLDGLVVSDSVFSMDGDIVHLPELVRLADRYGFMSMIDEAHALGVLGAGGYGTVEHFSGKYIPDIIMGTMSKSLGGEGGFVCGDRILIDWLRNKARGYIFSTSLPASILAAVLCALKILQMEPERTARLRRNTELFCRSLRDQGIPAESSSAIVPVMIGDEGRAVEIARQLFDQGCLVSAIRYPTVAKNSARLRIALMSSHTETELKNAAWAIARLCRNN